MTQLLKSFHEMACERDFNLYHLFIAGVLTIVMMKVLT